MQRITSSPEHETLEQQKAKRANPPADVMNLTGHQLTCAAEDEVQHIQVLGPKQAAVLALGVGVAVHDGSAGCHEHEDVQAGRHHAIAHPAPLPQAQAAGLDGAGQAVDRQLHAARLLLYQRRQASAIDSCA